MPATADSIYNHPRYYDLIFAADWKPELEFLQAVFRKHVKRPVRSLFEPACGTGRLVYRFCQAGFKVAGNDLNSQAIEFCNQRLQRNGFRPTATVGDMTNFQLRRPVDAAFNTINSFRHLQSDSQAIDHLRCMAAAIRPGGVYVLGFHLTPTRGEICEDESWQARRGSLTVKMETRLIERNLKQRFERYSMAFKVQTPNRRFRIDDDIKFRTYTLAQFKRVLDQIPQFELVALYDFSYDIDQPVAPSARLQDVVFVLRVK